MLLSIYIGILILSDSRRYSFLERSSDVPFDP